MVVQVQVVRQVVVLTRSIYRRFSLPRERQLSEASDNFSENGLCGAFPIFMRDPSQMCGGIILLWPTLVPSLISSELNFNFGDVASQVPSTNQTCVSQLRESNGSEIRTELDKSDAKSLMV